jgi:hypothetical protein
LLRVFVGGRILLAATREEERNRSERTGPREGSYDGCFHLIWFG